jgi:hypothetical protein
MGILVKIVKIGQLQMGVEMLSSLANSFMDWITTVRGEF